MASLMACVSRLNGHGAAGPTPATSKQMTVPIVATAATQHVEIIAAPLRRFCDRVMLLGNSIAPWFCDREQLCV